MSARFHHSRHVKHLYNKHSNTPLWFSAFPGRDNYQQFQRSSPITNYQMVAIPQQIVFDPKRNLVSVVQSYYLPIYPTYIPPYSTVVLGDTNRQCDFVPSDNFQRGRQTRHNSVSHKDVFRNLRDVSPVSFTSHTNY